MTSRADPTHFDAVDGNDADFFVEFLDARTTIPTEVLIKRHILAELQLSGGLSVLDVGSGTGADTCDAAAAVLPGGSVIGVDVSTHMVEEGRRRAAALGIPAEFVRGDVRDLAFPDATFDRCRAERVLAVVDGEPEAAIRELARVTKPGGLVVVSEIDAGTLFVNSTDSAVADRLADALATGLPNAHIGRHLHRHFLDAGLVDVRCVPLVALTSVAFLRLVLGELLRRLVDAGEVTSATEASFWAGMEEAAEAGWLCSGVTAFTVTGRKP